MNHLLIKANKALANQDYKTASQLSKKILHANPQNHSAGFILAVSLGALGSLDASLKQFNKLLSLHPNNPELIYNLGLVYQMNNHTSQAIEQYKLCISLNSQHALASFNLATLFAEIKQHHEALGYFEKAHYLQSNNFAFRAAYSNSLYLAKRFQESIKLLQPYINSPELTDSALITLIKSHIDLGDTSGALELTEQHLKRKGLLPFYQGLINLKMTCYVKAKDAFTESIRLNPDHVPSLMNLCLAYCYLGNFAAAEENLKNLEQLSKNNLEYVIFKTELNELLNKSNDTDNLEKLLSTYPDEAKLKHLLAIQLIKDKAFTKAEDLLMSLKDSTNPDMASSSYFELAQLFHKQQNYTLAWEHYQTANKIDTVDDHSVIQYLNGIRDQIKMLKDSEKGPTEISKVDLPRQVFIVGFPRSGTTLIDSIINTAPNTKILEEITLLDELANQLITDVSGNYYEYLFSLDEVQLNSIRNQYFSRMHDYVDWNGKDILVYKSPINMVHTPLVHILFPNAPIVFSVRHPLDSCLSCYTQNFKTSSQLNQVFKNFDSIVETYRLLFEFWNTSIEKLPIRYAYFRYEDLVTQAEQETKKLAEFCQIPWSRDLLDFYKKTNNRGMISNPSYNQVNKPLYTESMYKFQHYMTYLSDYHQKLEQWIDYFSYKKNPG